MEAKKIKEEKGTDEDDFTLENICKLKRSLVLIYSDEGTDTGFFLKVFIDDVKTNFLVTNNHIIGKGMIDLLAIFTLKYEEEKEEKVMELSKNKNLYL